MAEKEYLSYLSEDGSNRFRYSHVIEKGRILRFRIQYEAQLAGRWYPIVRYDTAHGFPHRDTIHPDGTEEKDEFPGVEPGEVLTIGERDIKANWQKYRTAFEQELIR